MVMEAPPSPQSVGREFVRQYYTLLNKAPTHLHRFYNHQSSFVHGGLDPPNRETTPVIGQKQIHQKIQQLNFRDCHAKITQVDSQATLGNGVVVQVTGELSNAGQPMRRFTQTFVLAAQSPKKYYVHNDIFRYQDEIISDEECEADAHSDVEEDVIGERQAKPVLPPEVPPPIPTMPQYYNVSAPSTPLQPPNISQVPIHHNQQHPSHVMGSQPPVATVNGAIHPDDISVIPNQVPAHIPSSPAQPNLTTGMPGLQQGLVQNPMKPPTPIDDQQSSAIEDTMEELDQNFSDQQDIEHEQNLPMESASIEPKTYANLLKSGNHAIPPYSNQMGGSVAPSAPLVQQQQQQQQPQQQQQQQQPVRPISPTGGVGTGFSARSVVPPGGLNNRGGSGVRLNQQQPTRLPNRQDSGRGNMVGRNSINEEGSYEDKRRSQGPSFNDTNQLFLGNLPHTASDEELREIFSQYGKITELRILSKPVSKMGGPQGGARLPPNYGFITYESEMEVKACLSAKPIFYPKNDQNGTPLNVEEKKTKGPYGGGGGRPLPEPNLRAGRGEMGGSGGQRRGGAPNRNASGGQGGGGAPGPNSRSSNSYNMSSRGGPQGRGGAPGAYRR